jgi:hypothetical protein
MRKLPLAAALMLALAPGAQAQVTVRQQPQPEPQQAPQAAEQGELDRFARARDNYIALRDGRRSVNDLTALELQDVLDLDRRVRGDYPDTRTARQRCVDEEVRRAGGRPSQLARQVINLKCRD